MENRKDFEQYIDDAVALFIGKMQARLNQSINMGLSAQLVALDVIGEVTFSTGFGFMDVGSDNGFFVQIENVLRSGAWLGQIPALCWIHAFLSPIIGNDLDVTARDGRIRDFASQEIEIREKFGGNHQDILSKLLEKQKQRPDEINDANVLSMATSNITAGSDTTAISTRSGIYHVLKNSE